MSFKPGDIIKLKADGRGMAARSGATAIVETYESKEEYPLKIKWIRNKLDKGQNDGSYEAEDFTLVNSQQKLEEKQDRLLLVIEDLKKSL